MTFILETFLSEYKGGVSVEEGSALSRYAANCINAPVVEIGSFRGKSAIALADGANRAGVEVFCVDPHARFVGYYGGQFGPDDRGAFFQVMLDTGFFRSVTLVGLRSREAAKAWKGPLGLLFIDGDHSPHGVLADVDAWERHLCVGGVIAFDDALDAPIGPSKVIEQLLLTGRFVHTETIGKIKFLRKLGQEPGHAPYENHKKILIACHDITWNGGFFRFERFGRVARAWGHEVAFLLLATTASVKRVIEFPTLNFDQASAQNWDATMVPGAGFPTETVELLSGLREPQFGLRMQHVLNDQTRRASFIAVNRAFSPQVVIFNNRHWEPGSFTDFHASQFRFLEGAVDTSLFYPTRYWNGIEPSTPFVIGGLASKNCTPLINAIRNLGEGIELRLFGETECLENSVDDLVEKGPLKILGPLSEAELPEFYRGLDCVVHTDTAAGWANLGAEALAAGVPLICTPHGTLAFAEHGVSALVMTEPTEDQISSNINLIRENPRLAEELSRNGRRTIISYSWENYANVLLRLTNEDYTEICYTWDPELNLYGKWPPSMRLRGLEYLLEQCDGKSVLDLGIGEGAVAHAFLQRGAAVVHGVDHNASCVVRVRAISERFANSRFWRAELSDMDALNATLNCNGKKHYDIVLSLGIHHHLPARVRVEILRFAANLSTQFFAIRTPEQFFIDDEITCVLTGAGFHLKGETLDTTASGAMGPIRIYRREQEK